MYVYKNIRRKVPDYSLTTPPNPPFTRGGEGFRHSAFQSSATNYAADDTSDALFSPQEPLCAFQRHAAFAPNFQFPRKLERRRLRLTQV